ncbi:neuronal pentraxin-1-like [Emydura macquarii macquarii]|uniref:neuronal pentraxin-1-like n=1 Tax=Emydura macquarii macquarii TaxID=1129001 RepID=UPI00352B0604
MRLAWAVLWALCWAPGGGGEHALPKFVCSPMPLELEPGCQPPAPQPRAGGHWAGTLEEAKETILHLRETVVHQKETILDQRETVRELTAKLSRCEAEAGGEHGPGGHEDNHSHGHREGAGWENGYPHFGPRERPEPPGVGHEAAFRKAGAAPNTMEDPPREVPASAPQLEHMLESLKERLEHLQHSRNSSLFSISLRDALQKKISILEQQIREKFNATEHHDHSHEELHRHKSEGHGPQEKEGAAWLEERNEQLEGMKQDVSKDGEVAGWLVADHVPLGHKPEKPAEAFRVGFPLRTNYMYVKVKRTLHHEIFAFSACLWLKSSSAPGVGTPFSYSVPGQANELVLIEWGNNPMELLINDKAATLPLAIHDAKWHHICVTWSTRDGIWESYQDGVRRGSGENLAPWHPIKSGGVFILGQEQDTLGGRFDATQAFIGELADFNLWSHVLAPGEIYRLATCTSHARGDLVAWAEPAVELHGGVAKLPFNACH